MLKAFAIFSLTSTLAAGLLWGPLFFIAGIVLTLVGVTYFFFRRFAQISVGELETAVVMSADEKRFIRFLPPGVHIINPFTEAVVDTISTAGQSMRGKTTQVQTSGGLPVSVGWAVKFSVYPTRMRRSKAPKMARTLSTKAGAIVGDHLQHILHHALESYTIEQLCQPGVHEKLERVVRQELASRLSDLGIKFSRIMIEAIEKPAQVINALEAAHERQIQAEQEAAMLDRLQRVISRFSDEDMRRLVELEKIHALGRNGVAMVYPAVGDQYSVISRPRQPVILDPFSNKKI